MGINETLGVRSIVDLVFESKETMRVWSCDHTLVLSRFLPPEIRVYYTVSMQFRIGALYGGLNAYSRECPVVQCVPVSSPSHYVARHVSRFSLPAS